MDPDIYPNPAPPERTLRERIDEAHGISNPEVPTRVMTPEDHARFVRVCLVWIIVLLAVMTIVALLVAYNVVELDSFVHNLQSAVNNGG